VVGVVRGVSLGCELPQSCGLRGHVWLLEQILSCRAVKSMNVLCANAFSPNVLRDTMWPILEILGVF